VEAGNAAVRRELRREPERFEDGAAFARHGEVTRARGDHQDPARTRRGRSPGDQVGASRPNSFRVAGEGSLGLGLGGAR